MRMLVFVLGWVASFAASTFASVAIYKHRERVRVALEVLRGRVKISQDGIARCEREHLEPSCVQVKKQDFDNLKKVADEHKVALGFIAAKDNKDFAKTIEQVMDGR